MKRAVLISGLTAAAIALTAVGVSAKGGDGDRRGPGGPRINFEEVDTNGDGLITLEEMQAAAAARTAEIDTDGDGFVSAEELAEIAKRDVSDRVAKMLERRDENGDGQVSLEEMQPSAERQERMFERLDEDGDGAISEEELASMKKFGKRKGGHRHADKETENN